jgi:hypothetical protein
MNLSNSALELARIISRLGLGGSSFRLFGTCRGVEEDVRAKSIRYSVVGSYLNL